MTHQTAVSTHELGHRGPQFVVLLQLFLQMHDMLLQRLQLGLLVVYARHRWREWRLPLVDERPVMPRRLLRSDGGGHVLETTATASDARGVCVSGGVIVLRNGSDACNRVHHTIPAIFHIRNAADERFFTLPRRPVVAR